LIVPYLETVNYEQFYLIMYIIMAIFYGFIILMVSIALQARTAGVRYYIYILKTI
jgi:hypothetical protein